MTILIIAYIFSFIVTVLTIPFWALPVSLMGGFGAAIGVVYVIFYAPLIGILAGIVYLKEMFYPSPTVEDMKKIKDEKQREFENSKLGKHFAKVVKDAKRGKYP